MNKISCFIAGIFIGFSIIGFSAWIMIIYTNSKFAQSNFYKTEYLIPSFDDDMSLSNQDFLLLDDSHFFDIKLKQNNNLDKINPNAIQDNTQELIEEIREQTKRIEEEIDRVWDELFKDLEKNNKYRTIA